MADQKDVEFDIRDQPSKDELKLETTKTFTVEWNNPETGITYMGVFTAKRPTLADAGQIAIIKARLCGGERVDADIDFVNEMIAYLQVVLTKFPDWWTPHEFFDASPLRKVWDHVRGWQDSFRARAVARRASADSADSAAKAADGVAPAVVVPSVQQTA